VKRRRRISIALALLLTLVRPNLAYSQDPANKVFAALTSDSTVWQRILVYTVGTLSSQLVATATDPSAQPWRLTISSDSPQEQLVRTQLQTILRMREVMPADTIVRALEFGPLIISNDTARVEVRFEETRKCPGTGRTTGSGWETTVLVPREPRQKLWGAAFSRITRGGDRIGC
jgi:hypothetical protein